MAADASSLMANLVNLPARLYRPNRGVKFVDISPASGARSPRILDWDAVRMESGEGSAEPSKAWYLIRRGVDGLRESVRVDYRRSRSFGGRESLSDNRVLK